MGGLIAYGPSLDEEWHRIAGVMASILRGSRPAELPFQRPTRFELDPNPNAARQINVEIPQSILLRANRVVD